MLRYLLAAAFLAVAADSACAADNPTSSGSGALALAGVVGLQNPSIKAADKEALLAFLDGEPKKVERVAAFTVTAASVVCRASDVGISSHRCELVFGGRTVNVVGRAAHEIYATGLENGVQVSPGAGQLNVGLSALECKLDPAQIAQNGGGGASCDFKQMQ